MNVDGCCVENQTSATNSSQGPNGSNSSTGAPTSDPIAAETTAAAQWLVALLLVAVVMQLVYWVIRLRLCRDRLRPQAAEGGAANGEEEMLTARRGAQRRRTAPNGALLDDPLLDDQLNELNHLADRARRAFLRNMERNREPKRSKEDALDAATEALSLFEALAQSAVDPEESCPMCLDPLPAQDCLRVLCGHVIHIECMREFLAHKLISYSAPVTCPMCRATVLIQNSSPPPPPLPTLEELGGVQVLERLFFEPERGVGENEGTHQNNGVSAQRRRDLEAMIRLQQIRELELRHQQQQQQQIQQERAPVAVETATNAVAVGLEDDVLRRRRRSSSRGRRFRQVDENHYATAVIRILERRSPQESNNNSAADEGRYEPPRIPERVPGAASAADSFFVRTAAGAMPTPQRVATAIVATADSPPQPPQLDEGENGELDARVRLLLFPDEREIDGPTNIPSNGSDVTLAADMSASPLMAPPNSGTQVVTGVENGNNNETAQQMTLAVMILERPRNDEDLLLEL